MRIAIFNHIARYGGTEVHIERLRAWLGRHGVETRLFLPEDFGLDPQRRLKPWEPRNSKILSAANNDGFDLSLVFAYRPFGTWLPYLRRMSGPVVLSVVDYWISCPRLTRICEGCPSVSCKSRSHRIFKATFPFWNGFYWFEFHSQHVLDQTRSDGFHPHHWVVLHHGVDVERFRPMGLDRQYDVLYVGRLEREKGVEILLGVVADIIRMNPAFTAAFAGQGRLDSLVKELAEKHPANVVRLGFVGDADLPALYNSARIFVHYPTWEEPFGLTPLEAMACGTDVLVADQGGMREFVPASCRVPSGSPQLLKEAVLERLQSTEETSHLRRQVEERFSEDVVFRQYLDFYASLLK